MILFSAVSSRPPEIPFFERAFLSSELEPTAWESTSSRTGTTKERRASLSQALTNPRTCFQNQYLSRSTTISYQSHRTWCAYSTCCFYPRDCNGLAASQIQDSPIGQESQPDTGQTTPSLISEDGRIRNIHQSRTRRWCIIGRSSSSKSSNVYFFTWSWERDQER